MRIIAVGPWGLHFVWCNQPEWSTGKGKGWRELYLGRLIIWVGREEE